MSKQIDRLSFMELLSPDLPWLILGHKSYSKIELISVLSGYQLGKPRRFCGRIRAEA